MVSLLFKLLVVQMTIQLTMATALEGRTSHFVDIVDPPTADADAQLITCPIYSIRPATFSTKYTKYIISEAQANTLALSPAIGISSFKNCARYAAENAQEIFMWDVDECRTLSAAIPRSEEPCNDDTATVIYMAS